MESQTGNEVLWTAAQVADYLQVAERSVTNWVKAGRIPVVKVGDLNRFRKSEIDAWLDSKARPAIEPTEKVVGG